MGGLQVSGKFLTIKPTKISPPLQTTPELGKKGSVGTVHLACRGDWPNLSKTQGGKSDCFGFLSRGPVFSLRGSLEQPSGIFFPRAGFLSTGLSAASDFLVLRTSTGCGQADFRRQLSVPLGKPEKNVTPDHRDRPPEAPRKVFVFFPLVGVFATRLVPRLLSFTEAAAKPFS